MISTSAASCRASFTEELETQSDRNATFLARPFRPKAQRESTEGAAAFAAWMIEANAWAAISVARDPLLLGIFGGRLQHPMQPPLWLAPSRYLWTSSGWPCRLGCRRL